MSSPEALAVLRGKAWPLGFLSPFIDNEEYPELHISLTNTDISLRELLKDFTCVGECTVMWNLNVDSVFIIFYFYFVRIIQ